MLRSKMATLLTIVSAMLISAGMTWLVQEPVDPRHVPTGVVGHAKRTVGVAQSMRLSYPESHRRASSNRR
jgi:hypothetical protein